MPSEHKPYNYFRQQAKQNLLKLCGIENPTTEQHVLADNVVYCIERYAASKH